jgi:ankyrin repeat protein
MCWTLLKAGEVNRTKIFVNYASNNCTTSEGYRHTPLIYAAANHHVVVVRVLMEGGINAETSNTHQWTALHTAAYYGHTDVCHLLLDWGAKVNPVDQLELTLLHDPAVKGNLTVVKLLVERGADVRLKDYKNQTSSDLARNEGYSGVADWLGLVSRD